MHRTRFYLCTSAICVLTACLFICLKIEYVCSSAAAVILIYAGGAPCNVLAMLNNLGRKTAFIGKVGDDAFGHMLADTVSQSGTDTSGLVFDPFVHTTLAFVHTMPGGDRSFSFYRNPGADMMFRKDEISGECIRSSIFHFGTLSSTHPGVREATRHALQIARDSGALLSFDPNLRESLWDSLVDVRREIEYGLTQCDILRRDLSSLLATAIPASTAVPKPLATLLVTMPPRDSKLIRRNAGMPILATSFIFSQSIYKYLRCSSSIALRRT